MKLRLRVLPTEHPSSRHCVYTHRAANGSPLYVGISRSLEQRTRQHASVSEWFHVVASIDVLRVATREEAFRVELSLIEALRPPFNCQNNPSHAALRRRRRALDRLRAESRSPERAPVAAVTPRTRSAADSELTALIDSLWRLECDSWRRRLACTPSGVASRRRRLHGDPSRRPAPHRAATVEPRRLSHDRPSRRPGRGVGQ